MNELHLVSPIPPSVNHYLSYRAVMKNGRALATSYKTSEAVRYRRDFAAYVNSECDRQGWDMVPNKVQHFYVDTIFYFPRVDLDCNNYFKVMLDAITDTQRIWLDDNVTLERVFAIYYDSKNPRIEITIHPVDYIGVFENTSQAAAFESVCVGCKRYTRNCSILDKAKCGKIQDEVIGGRCIKYSPLSSACLDNAKQGNE